MTAKEYLQQARITKIRLASMAEQVAYLKSAAEYCSPTFNDSPHAHQPNIRKTEDTFIRLMEWEEKLAEQFVQLDEINKKLDTLTDPIQHTIIVKHYLSGKTWRQISAELHYSERAVRYIHTAALGELQKSLP